MNIAHVASLQVKLFLDAGKWGSPRHYAKVLVTRNRETYSLSFTRTNLQSLAIVSVLKSHDKLSTKRFNNKRSQYIFHIFPKTMIISNISR